MEIHSATTRFTLACNQSTKIIEPIQSRCAIVRFMKLSEEDLLSRLMHVCKEEGVSVQLIDSIDVASVRKLPCEGH